MAEHPIPLGLLRGPADDCRRYRPIRFTFDTRNVILDVEIQDEWDPETTSMWEKNKAQVRAELVAEHGPTDGAQKLDNYRAMGPAPWSVVFEHSALLAQIRSSFTHSAFYPALVGACALGERLLHQLALALRVDFLNHPSTTKRVRSGNLGNEWGSLITVLHAWGVFDEDVADLYHELERRRQRPCTSIRPCEQPDATPPSPPSWHFNGLSSTCLSRTAGRRATSPTPPEPLISPCKLRRSRSSDESSFLTAHLSALHTEWNRIDRPQANGRSTTTPSTLAIH